MAVELSFCDINLSFRARKIVIDGTFLKLENGL